MPGFTFNADAQRFRSVDTGRFVSQKTVRAVIDNDIDATKARMQEYARSLQSGTITTEAFQDAMAQEIKDGHLCAMGMARGGSERMRKGDYGRAGQRIKFNYQALQGLMADIEADPEYIHGMAGRMDFVERVGMYSESIRNSYERARLTEMKQAGFGSMENELEPTAHHCDGINSCIAMSALGRVPIGDVRFKMPGDRSCITRCRCNVNYYKSAAS